ncbi:MAG: hypothetical protein HUU21_33975 [Polyangiaceae bacterium]|nr:hypothetical protein [Polyangiaceae bacterium]
MRVRRPIHVVVLTLSIATLATPAAAQVGGGQNEASAAALFQEAMNLFEKKQFDETCPKFLQSYELDRTKPGGLYANAECLAEAGKIASAVARYGEYVRAVDELPPERQAVHNDRKARAKEQITALGPDVPELTISLHSLTHLGTRVTHNGEALTTEQLDKPRVVDPGEHRVTSEAPGAPPVEERFTLQKGEKRRVVLKGFKPSANVSNPVDNAAPNPPKTSESRGFDFSTAGTYAGFGVGAMGLVVGTVTGAIAISKKGLFESECSVQNDVVISCTDNGFMVWGSGQALQTVSIMAFGFGLAGAVTGTVFKLTTGDGEAKQPFNVWRLGGYGALGAGGAGLVLGAITGAMALGKRGTVYEGCGYGTRAGVPVRECDEEAFKAAHSGQAFGAVSTGAFIAGGVGLALGAGLLLFEPTPSESVWTDKNLFAIGPTSLSLNGMEIGVQGRW